MDTVQDIFAAAMIAGREQFRAALIKQAEMHDDFAQTTRNARARASAEHQRAACLSAYDDVAYGAIGELCADLSKCVIALNVACKLIGVSPAKRTAAFVQWDETQKSRGLWL